MTWIQTNPPTWKVLKEKKKDVDIDVDVDVELDVDAKAIVNLSSNNDSSSVDFASILVNCRQFLNQIPALKISHRLAYFVLYNLSFKK